MSAQIGTVTQQGDSESSQWTRALTILLPLVAILGLLELIVRLGWVEAYLVPSPTQVAHAVWVDRVEFAQALLDTAWSSVLGFATAVIGGTLLALIFSLSQPVERAFYPYAVFFQTVPIVAVAPLLVIWFGFGRPAVVAASAIVAFFPVLAGGLAGLRTVERGLDELFRLYGASRLRTLFQLRVPSALPVYLTGLRVASGLAIVGALVGELIGNGGLGAVIDVAKTQQRVDKVFAAVLGATLLGFLASSVVGRLEAWARDRFGRA